MHKTISILYHAKIRILRDRYQAFNLLEFAKSKPMLQTIRCSLWLEAKGTNTNLNNKVIQTSRVRSIIPLYDNLPRQSSIDANAEFNQCTFGR